MAQLFYKINDGVSLHVMSLPLIQSLSDFQAYNSYISSQNSYYENNTTGSSSGGTFPDYNSSNVTLQNLKSLAYSTSSSGTLIYRDALLAKYQSVRGSAPGISNLTNGDVITFCDSKGNSCGITATVIMGQSSGNSLVITIRIKFDSSTGYTGYHSIELSSTKYYSSAATIDNLFFFTDGGGALGVAFMTIATSAPYSTYNYCAVAYGWLYYSSYPHISPFLYYLDTVKNAVYGASGSNAAQTQAGGAMSTGTRGGDGVYDFSNTDITIDDDMPSSSPAITAGFINPYYVTASEIASLGNFLWSSDFFDSIAKTFSNPMDCIISLSSFPVASSSMSLGSSESVRVGNTTSSSTGTRLASEFITIDCGTVSVPEVWGSYLDYAQTKLYIYIPYLGIEELPLCECMGGSVSCSLHINLLTGALVACVTLTSGTYVTGSARVQPIYFSTTCKSDIPVSGATTGALAGAFQLLGGATSAIAGVATGVAPLAISGLASAAQGVATMQSQNSQISGAVGAAGGQMAHKIPFLIFDHPVQSVPANLASVAGYQSNSGTTLSRCSGYVICDTINLDGLALTRSELEEVEQICTSGVYIS